MDAARAELDGMKVAEQGLEHVVIGVGVEVPVADVVLEAVGMEQRAAAKRVLDAGAGEPAMDLEQRFERRRVQSRTSSMSV